MPCSHSATISAAVPSTRYSFGMPTRSPLMSVLRAAAAKSGTGSGAEVESFGSWPDIACSRIAESSTVRANGPGWSSELANATTPQREQRP